MGEAVKITFVFNIAESVSANTSRDGAALRLSILFSFEHLAGGLPVCRRKDQPMWGSFLSLEDLSVRG